MSRRSNRRNNRRKYPVDPYLDPRRDYRRRLRRDRRPAEPLFPDEAPYVQPTRDNPRKKPDAHRHDVSVRIGGYTVFESEAAKDRRCRTYHDKNRKSRKKTGGGSGRFRLSLGQLKYIIQDRRKC
jgi:hypothetical protein